MVMGGTALTLPRLRSEIEFHRTSDGPDDTPCWLIHDPLQSRNFRINGHTRAIISIWQAGLTADALVEEARQKLGLSVTPDSVKKLLDFLVQSNLTERDGANCWQDLLQQKRQSQRSPLMRLMQGHLFLKIPVLQPNRFLQTSYPTVKFLHRWPIALAVMILGVVGLYLASRNPTELREAAVAAVTLQGAVSFVFALLIVKLAHEFGHAYAATRYGCRVPSMGIAFMFMVPVFYTDVSDTWRLDKRQRMIVCSAGIAVEIMLALAATFVWSLMSDGPARDVVFIMASTSWIISLAVNLNPLMRFDGYYLMSDYFEIENLQSRAFKFGKWQLRRLLFAASLPAPEPVEFRTERILTGYAMLACIYRVFMFVGISILTYQFFFKAAGLILLSATFWFLILAPVSKEIRAWKSIDAAHTSRIRGRTSVTLVLVLVASLFLPLSGTVSVPAVLQAADLVRIYPPRTALIQDIAADRNDFVEQGDPILLLQLPELEAEIEEAQALSNELKTRLSRSASDPQERVDLTVLRRQVLANDARIAGLEEERAELLVTAPVAGRIVQMASGLHVERWVTKDTLLAIVTSQSDWIVRGYATQTDIERVEPGAIGRFIPDDLTQPSIEVRLNELPTTAE
jgi:putative peptide zinc metalloprotease protein